MASTQEMHTGRGDAETVGPDIELTSPTQKPAGRDTKVTGDIEIQGHEDDDVEIQKPVYVPDNSGVARIEAVQAVWGLHGKKSIIAGLALVMVMYELDNTTVYTYYIYAQSHFNQVSSLATLETAGGIVFSVIKPLCAKIADVIGRGETYFLVILLYILSYILCAASSTYGTYAAGYMFHILGQSCLNTMNDILIADITTARWRGFAVAVSFAPFLVMPWVSAFICQSVVDGIGWRWGIGMLAILLPFSASFILFTLLWYQRKAKKIGIVSTQKLSLYGFFSLVDAGGLFLLIAGFAMVLLPLTLAGTAPQAWKTPWIAAMIAVGGVLLIALPFYEKYMAVHPIMPLHWFNNRTINLTLACQIIDSLAFRITHVYLYTWAVIGHNYSVRDATFLNMTNGVVGVLSGIVAGGIMYRYRKYKWAVMFGAVIRTIGYGMMMRWRTIGTSTAEMFIIQFIQGFGSGFISIPTFVVATVSVSHKELAQMTAFAVCVQTIGSSIGAAIAGGIYTGTFKSQLANELGPGASQSLIDTLFNSITAGIPTWGTADRIAISKAYSNVITFCTYAAFAISIPTLIIVWFIPNITLP